MTTGLEPCPVAKKAAPPPPPPDPDRVTVLNIKGTTAERETLHSFSRKTGVPVSEMTRRALAAWMKARGGAPPEGWLAD